MKGAQKAGFDDSRSVIGTGFKTRFGILLSLARKERGEYQSRAEIAENAEKNAVDRPPSGPIREKEGGRRHLFFARSAISARYGFLCALGESSVFSEDER